MTDKFTPGPWRATAKRVTAPETEDRLALDVQINGGNAADNKANARLIAAAPDLLAALRDCLAFIERDMPTLASSGPERFAALEAIQKATGAKQ